MPDAIWIDQDEQLQALAQELGSQGPIGVDTEFLRERTFFPKLCLLQICAGAKIWCIDTLKLDLKPLVPLLTAAAAPKIIHAARQDLEAFYLTSSRVITPVFDTQIAAGCIGLKPQIGYAELASVLIGVTVTKGQTRTDWSKRPLSAEQLDYAADDVLHLDALAARLSARLRELGREHWVREDCSALEQPELYEPNPAKAWERLRGLAQLEPASRGRAKALAVWRERLARDRNLPRSWIIADAAIFDLAQANPASIAQLRAVPSIPASFNESFAASLLAALSGEARSAPEDLEPSQESRPNPAQKALAQELNKIVDARAAELGVSAEILAPRGELKALAMGRRDAHALSGWRRSEIGERLLAQLDGAQLDGAQLDGAPPEA
ncbi:MAG TPA: ribonuclease D [Steroidobacteraceae bacterium]|nr:ribonuclease D [Steroidobacteraceae bacterium]